MKAGEMASPPARFEREGLLREEQLAPGRWLLVAEDAGGRG